MKNRIAYLYPLSLVNYRLYLIFLFLVHFCIQGFGQILDDSTKQVYNANTTKFVYENDFLENDYKIVKTDTTLFIMGAKRRVDTLIDGLHNYNFIWRGKNFYQDLGNYLTPIQNIYYEQPNEIGKRLGYSSVDLYAINPKTIKYYDTKSPYSKINYVQGSKGQQGIEVEFSQNIKPNWNIGFDLRRQTSKKILGTNNGVGGGIKALESSDYFFAFYTRFYSKNERYQLLANFTHGHQVSFNNGGIKRTKKDSIISENFQYEQAETYFTSANARSIDKRHNYHLYQEYSLTQNKKLQLYTISDYGKKTIRFNNLLYFDNKYLRDTLFYTQTPLATNPNKLEIKKQFNFTSMTMADRTDYMLLENQVGVKATFGKINIRGYYRRKDFTYQQLYYTNDSLLFSRDSVSLQPADKNPVDRKFFENFVGTQVIYKITEKAYARFDGEYMLGRDYRYGIEVGQKYFRAGYSKMYYSPTLVQLENRSNAVALTWNNFNSDGSIKFLNTQTDKAFGSLKWERKNFVINPGLSYELIRNLVYYDTLARPSQAKSDLSFLSADLFLAVKFWRINVETYTKYTKQNIDSFWVVPPIFNKNRIYIENDLFKKAAVIQLGFDTYWRPSYYGYKYMPITQQFYSNHNFELKSFFQVDVFLNVQIKNASVFLKYSYLNKGKGGYFITPGYTSIPSSFDFGIRWMFYD